MKNQREKFEKYHVPDRGKGNDPYNSKNVWKGAADDERKRQEWRGGKQEGSVLWSNLGTISFPTDSMPDKK